MAMIDYGVIAKKNGVVLNDRMFTEMKETLGFEVEKDDKGYDVKDNYFIYLGDKDFYIAIYKGMLKVFKDENKHIKTIWDIDNYASNVCETKHRYKVTIEDVEFDIKRIRDNNRYYLRFTYKGDLYEAMYGYGVDCDIEYWYDMSPNLKRRVERFIGK